MKKNKTLGVIPARLNSTRLPRKMLANIEGKPLIYYTWKQAKKASKLDEVIVATDNKEIEDAVKAFGGKVVMTSSRINTGSDRVAAAAKLFKDFIPDIVINLQGDEPLMPPAAINKTVDLLIKNPKAVMSTVSTPLANKRELDDPNIVKVVCDKDGNALYFSRSRLPYDRMPYPDFQKHLGIYGFRRSFLFKYVSLKQTPLEKAELLEQLRALENGYDILVGAGKFERTEVNIPAELRRVRAIIKGKRKR